MVRFEETDNSIRRGLLKVEQLHALARDIYYGRRGRINARELHEQMNSCSCLTLLLACVVYWQAKEISRVLKMGIPEGEDIDISLLEHVSKAERIRQANTRRPSRSICGRL